MANAMLKSSNPDLANISNDSISDASSANQHPTTTTTTTLQLQSQRQLPRASVLTTTATTNNNGDDDDDDRVKTPPRKTVDFAILPPPKRSRMDTPTITKWTPKQVVDAVGTSISQQERLDAIQKAKASFAHSVQMVHDEEIVAGADAALTKHLTFLLWQSKHADVACELAEGGTADGDDDPHVLAAELGMACEAMESLFQASSVTVGASFRRMGRDILRLLVTILDNEINRRLQSVSQHMAEVEREKEAAAKQGQAKQSNDDDDHHYHEASAGNSNEQSSVDAEEGVTGSDLVTSEMKNTRLRSITPPVHDDLDALIFTQEGDLLLQKVTRILGHFARVGDATKPMAHFPGLLGCLISLITFHPYDNVPWEARLSSLWTIANLGCNPENMRMMVCCPRLVESLIEVASRPLHPSDSLERTMELLRSRSISSRVILNLSWAPETKIILSENATLIDLLAELSVHRNAPLSRSQTVKEILLTTRRYALGALRNLAAATRQVKIGLCDHKNGHLLDILTDAALNDADIMVKEYAFATIHNLATHDTAETMVNHPALVLALKDVLLSEQESHRDKGSPKSHASATLMVLERSITPEMSSYENLRDLLEAVTTNPATTNEIDDIDDEIINATAV